MRLALLLTLVSLTADARGRFERFCGRTAQGRSDRGFLCDDGAFFEAFPASGAGTTTACSTTPPTGAKGEALVYSRAGNVTCVTGTDALRATGLDDSSYVFLSANQIRVEANATGTLGIHGEDQADNIAVQSASPCNAAYSDVGTPSCVAAQAAGPAGAATMAQFTDNDGAGFEGRSQIIADTSQTIHTAFAHVKAGTATSASITMVGTGNSAGDCTGTISGASLSASTTSIVSCTGAAYGAGLTAITITVRVGTVASDTGTLFVYGYDAKVNAPKRTSHVPTLGTAVTRSSDVGARFAVSGLSTTFCMAATVYTLAAQAATGPQWLSLETTYGEAAPKALGYSNAGFANTFMNVAGLFSTGVAWTAGTHRLRMSSARTASFDATTTTTAQALLASAPAFVVITGNGTAGLPNDGITTNVIVDPSETRCPL
ncbi:MAG: hypothetical protein Q8K32_10990 [Archangium sp.]|nr:hypothetical protein [Archangium sp.]